MGGSAILEHSIADALIIAPEAQSAVASWDEAVFVAMLVFEEACEHVLPVCVFVRARHFEFDVAQCGLV